MRLCDDPKRYAPLFITVLPAFVRALPPPPGPSFFGLQDTSAWEREALKNSITLLRFELKEMQNALTESYCSCNLTGEEFNIARDALEDVLYLLEGLVDSEIPGYRVNQVKDSEFPKLHALDDNPHECENWISYGTAAARYRLIHSQAQRFNEIMKQIFVSPTTDTESQVRPFYYQEESASHDDHLAMTELTEAKRISDMANTLFSLLAEELKSCEPPHSAHIHLSGFSQPEIDMLMSLCGPNETQKWHGVLWSGRSHSGAPTRFSTSRKNICSTLKRSCKFKKRLRIHVSQDGSWDHTEASGGRLKEDITTPTLKLEDILHVKNGTRISSTRLLKKDRLHLANCITKSLLYLLGSPLSPEAWKTGTIYVAQPTESQVGVYRPYMFQEITAKTLKDEKGGSEFLLYLGVLLWELLFGRRVTIMPEDEEDDDEYQDISLFNALSREESDLRESCVEQPFLDIIANCLDIYPEVELDDQELRSKVYWEVLKPLQSYVEAYQASMSTAKACRIKSTISPLYHGHAEGKSEPRAGNPIVSGSSAVTRSFHHTEKRYFHEEICRDEHASATESRNLHSLPEEPQDGPYNGLGKQFMSPISLGESISSSRLELHDYKIGIVCALPKEHLAVRVLFDEKHSTPEIPSGDSNQYAFGSLGHHNVVTACLPMGNYGTNPAALIIANMKRTFTSIRYYFLVGIGGGIPSKQNDIRLGDVVVSIPEGSFPGVIQYDRGKFLGNDEFEKTGSLPPPPHEILNVISDLRSDPDLPQEPLQPYLTAISDRWPEYGHPGIENDKLLQNGKAPTTENKYTTFRSRNSKRINPGNNPKIHYGLIASGNQVIKDAESRDRLSRRYNALCVEMEAAGVANVTNCLVIRGICDYADSDKNRIWQEYASATAASYAKLLLSYLRRQDS